MTFDIIWHSGYSIFIPNKTLGRNGIYKNQQIDTDIYKAFSECILI